MIDVERFVARCRPRWRLLEQLLDVADASPAWELGRERVLEIVTLYRQACSDLNRARTLTANEDVLGPLNALVGRGYQFVHVRSRKRVSRARLASFFLVAVPATFRRRWRAVGTASLALGLGAAVGFLAVLARPELHEALVPPAFYVESPRERVERIERSEERVASVEEALTFGASLFTHNIRVGCLAFSLGALTIAGAHLLLFYNGVLLGAVAAAHHLDGVDRFFYAWVGPHGALELPAIAFGAAAGLVLGNAVLFPGDLARGAAIRRAAPDAWRMLAAAAVAFVAAGLVEGSFSQFSASLVPYELKISVAALLFAGLVAYLFLAGRTVRRVAP